ncbi:MAG: bifunctional adenosylcobinamide kinase/adenosylcobinamide-phosphate guanylyltransferase [Actinomycetota bacterium]
MALTLLTGGARSGKSVLAVRMASRANAPVVFVATAEPRDDEMAERIAEHRAARPASWTTVEEPSEIAAAISGAPADAFVVVDCLTVWVSNLLERGAGRDEITARALETAKAAAGRAAPVVVVTNEVGSGIVPMHPDTRAYRDLMGSVNAAFAAAAERVLLVVAGRVAPLADVDEAGL